MRTILRISLTFVVLIGCSTLKKDAVTEKDIPVRYAQLWQKKVQALAQIPNIKAYLGLQDNKDLTNKFVFLSITGKTHASSKDIEFKRLMMKKVTFNMSEQQCTEYFAKTPQGVIDWFKALDRSLSDDELKEWMDVSGRFIELGAKNLNPNLTDAKNFKLAVAELRIFSDIDENRTIDEFFNSMAAEVNDPRIFCEFSRVLYKNSDKISSYAKEEIFKNFSFETMAVSEDWI